MPGNDMIESELAEIRVRLPPDVMRWLDAACQRMKSPGGKSVARTALVRAVIRIERKKSLHELAVQLVLSQASGPNVRIRCAEELIAELKTLRCRLEEELERDVTQAGLVRGLLLLHVKSGGLDPDPMMLSTDPIRRGRGKKPKEGAK